MKSRLIRLLAFAVVTIAIVSMMTFSTHAGGSNAESAIPGDLNGDFVVDTRDSILLFRYVEGWDVELDVDALDITGDGTVDREDAETLFKYIAGWDVEIHRGQAHTHNLVFISELSPMCTQRGNTEYFYCLSCDKIFNDDKGDFEISAHDVIISPIGHNYVNNVCTRCKVNAPEQIDCIGGVHIDNDLNCSCDICKMKISHTDQDGDCQCDICGFDEMHFAIDVYITCKCIVCRQPIDFFHETLTNDCRCDFCGKYLEHIEDPYEYGLCGNCGGCLKCIDNDNDGLCDRENCRKGIDWDDAVVLPPDIIGKKDEE